MIKYNNKKGEGYIDIGIKIILVIVIGAVILGGFYLLFDRVILPKTNNNLESMVNTGNPIQVKMESGKVSYSYDGIKWKDSSITDTHPSDIATKMIVIGENENRVWLVTTYDSIDACGRLYTSTDGKEWVPTNADSSGRITIAKYSSGRVYANCNDGRQYYTVDGLNWTMTSTKLYYVTPEGKTEYRCLYRYNITENKCYRGKYTVSGYFERVNTPSEHLKKLLTRSGVPKSEIAQFID